MGVASEILELVQMIAKWIKEGISEEEIARRLDDPHGVGRDLLLAAAKRQESGRAYLGRDPR